MWWGYGLIALGSLFIVGIAIGSALRGASVRRQRSQIEEACRIFHRRREWVEARFLSLASRSGRPRGLNWVNCDFEDDVAFARDRLTGELRALVGVAISFEAQEGGGMEDVEAVGNLRAATSVFRFENGEWITDGRAIFNLNPRETIRHFGHELEAVL